MAEEPREEFKLGDVVFAIDVVVINGVADEVKTGDAETFLVNGIVEERVIFGLAGGLIIGGEFGDVSDADDGIMRIKCTSFAEVKREVARDDDAFFAIRKFVIEVATEIFVLIID